MATDRISDPNLPYIWHQPGLWAGGLNEGRVLVSLELRACQ